jgi:aryl-alcohol dehydrogenase-like predicted oxidoreductase
MIYKELGKSDIKISTLGFGGGIGGSKSSTSSYDKIGESLLRSIDLGVNFIDTSPIYGLGESERIIGKTLKGKRKNVILATKVSPGRTDYKGVIDSVDESLRRLKTDYIDLYQVHWPNPAIPLEETARAIEKIYNSGKIRSFGVSNFSFSEVKKINSLLSSLSLSSVQFEYNFCERSSEKNIIPYCLENSITPIAYTPLMRGKMAATKEQVNLLCRYAKKYNCSVAQVVLSWMCSLEKMVALTTSSKLERIKENFSATDFKLSNQDSEDISNSCIPPVVEIDTKFILKSSRLEASGYASLEDALENKNLWSPSPLELANQMKRGEFLKAIRLKRLKDSEYNLEILEGKLRFWSWVIAFGWDKKIPSIIWED